MLEFIFKIWYMIAVLPYYSNKRNLSSQIFKEKYILHWILHSVVVVLIVLFIVLVKRISFLTMITNIFENLFFFTGCFFIDGVS